VPPLIVGIDLEIDVDSGRKALVESFTSRMRREGSTQGPRSERRFERIMSPNFNCMNISSHVRFFGLIGIAIVHLFPAAPLEADEAKENRIDRVWRVAVRSGFGPALAKIDATDPCVAVDYANHIIAVISDDAEDVVFVALAREDRMPKSARMWAGYLYRSLYYSSAEQGKPVVYTSIELEHQTEAFSRFRVIDKGTKRILKLEYGVQPGGISRVSWRAIEMRKTQRSRLEL
jgi:hypothetical protein